MQLKKTIIIIIFIFVFFILTCGFICFKYKSVFNKSVDNVVPKNENVLTENKEKTLDDLRSDTVIDINKALKELDKLRK